MPQNSFFLGSCGRRVRHVNLSEIHSVDNFSLCDGTCPKWTKHQINEFTFSQKSQQNQRQKNCGDVRMGYSRTPKTSFPPSSPLSSPRVAADLRRKLMQRRLGHLEEARGEKDASKVAQGMAMGKIADTAIGTFADSWSRPS